MNYDSMTARELIHYLDLYSTDPVVRRLVSLFSNDSLIADLVDAGMDPDTQLFQIEWGHESPGEYIQSLRNSLRDAEDEASQLRYRCEDLEDELEQLKTRSIMDFIEEVRHVKRNSEELVSDAMKTIKAYKDENENLKEKIDMWGRMNQVKVRE